MKTGKRLQVFSSRHLALPVAIVTGMFVANVWAVRMARVAVLPQALQHTIQCGDADHDQRFEAFGRRSDTVVAFECTSGNNFERVLTGVTSCSFILVLGDGDGDGRSDLVINADFPPSESSICRIVESPDEHSFPRDSVWQRKSLFFCRAFFTDLDRDGHRELAVNGDGLGVELFESTRDNTYDSVATLAMRPWDVAVDFDTGDFDRDGLCELVAACPRCYLPIYEATGIDNQYVLAAICTTDTETGSLQRVETAGDMDRDGWLEFVVLEHMSGHGRVMVYEAFGKDQYHCVWQQVVPRALMSDQGLAVGDVDGDGVAEFLHSTGGLVQLFKCIGPDSYEQVWSVDSGEGNSGMFDLNRDDRAEIIFDVHDHCVIYEDTTGLTQVSEVKPPSRPLQVGIHPAVVRLGGSVSFSGLPEQSEVNMYSANGQLVRKQAVGKSANWRWNLTDQTGRPVPPGTYFVTIRSQGRTTQTQLCVIN